MTKCIHPELVLFPDYESSGVWCAQCGVMIILTTPTCGFPNVPAGLSELIWAWNSYWDYSGSPERIACKEGRQKSVNEMGRYLAERVNEFYPCWFAEESAEIIPWGE